MISLRRSSLYACLAIISAAVIVGPGLSSIAVAQDKAPAIKIAVVSLIDLQQQAKVWQDVRVQSTNLVKRFRAEAVKEQARLRKIYQNLERQCAVRSIQWCRRARIRINQQAQEFQRLNQVRRQQLGRSLQAARNKMLQETRRVVKAISVERGFTLVVSSGGLIHYAPAYDITPEVVKRLNKALPKMKLEFPVKAGKSNRPTKPRPAPKKKPAQ